jgi:hypothetical protein
MAAAHAVEIAAPIGRPMPFTSDAVDWLPPHGAAVLRRLRRQRQDARAAGDRLFDELTELRETVMRLENRLRQLREQFSLGDDDPRCADLLERISRGRNDIARLAEEQRQHGEQRQELLGLLAAIEKHIAAAVSQRGWIFQHRGSQTLPGHKQPEPRLGRGQDIASAIAGARQRIVELKGEVAAIAHAPVPIAERKAQIRADVAELARKGAPGLDPGGKIVWSTALLEVAVHVPPAPIAAPSEPEPEPVYGRRSAVVWDKAISTVNAGLARFEGGNNIPKQTDAAGAALSLDVLATLAWLNPDAIVAKLEASLPKDAPGALSVAERARKRGEAQATLLDAERQECSLIEFAATMGFATSYRCNTDARAVLSLA